VLPYEGGRGYATIEDLHAEPFAGQRKTATIRVRFEPGHTAYGSRLVAPREIVRKAEASS
jgi:hypothetical protein